MKLLLTSILLLGSFTSFAGTCKLKAYISGNASVFTAPWATVKESHENINDDIECYLKAKKLMKKSWDDVSCIPSGSIPTCYPTTVKYKAYKVKMKFTNDDGKRTFLVLKKLEK